MTEVEVKIRLPSKSEYDKVKTILMANPSHFLAEHQQHNFFFDGALAELSKDRAVMRFRFYDNKCLFTLKEKTVIQNGVATSGETEEFIDKELAKKIVDDPSKMSELVTKCPLLQQIINRWKCEAGFKCLGGFENFRVDFKFHGYKLELDQTMFDFGTAYEIEIETAEPQKASQLIEQFLKENQIEYKLGSKSKFANFLAKKLD